MKPSATENMSRVNKALFYRCSHLSADQLKSTGEFTWDKK